MKSHRKIPVAITILIGLCMFFTMAISAEAIVTVAGSGKTYGGVFVGGGDPGWFGRRTINENLNQYTNALKNTPDSGWSEDRMSIIPSSNENTTETVKRAIDRYKPGGDRALKPGDEFQFFFVGHGRPPALAYNKDAKGNPIITDLDEATLAKWLSGFPRSVTIAVILDTCYSYQSAWMLAKSGITNNKEELLDYNHLGIAWSAVNRNYILNPVRWSFPHFLFTSWLRKFIEDIKKALKEKGVANLQHIAYTILPPVSDKQTGDNDSDGKVDEDGSCSPTPEYEHIMGIDDDNDGEIDEDPAPQTPGYIEVNPVSPGSDVTIDFGEGMSATFDNITSHGKMFVVATLPAEPTPGNYRILSGGYFDITTTAGYSGYIVITLPYTESDVKSYEGDLKLFHWKGHSWEDVTVSVDTDNNTITGRVTSLSPFAVAEPAEPVAVPSLSGWRMIILILSGVGILALKRRFG